MSDTVQYIHHRRSRFTWALSASLWCFAGAGATGAEVDFYRDVYPILKANCIACHNKTTTKADLNMETPADMIKGGDSGPGVEPGKGAESLIVEAAAHKGDIVMPPKGNKIGAVDLTKAEVALLTTWIDQGAKNSVKQARQVVWQPLPPGVNPIYAVSLTQDGRYAACGRANQIFIYDLATRQFVTRLADSTLVKPDTPQRAGVAHRALVQSLAFSPDGTRLASAGFREVKIWRRETQPVTISPALKKEGDAALGTLLPVVTADGRQMVYADKQGTLHVANVADGKVAKSIPTELKSPARLLAVSPDAGQALLYTEDSSLSLWDLREGKRVAQKAGVNGVRALAWTSDGKMFATGGVDKNVQVWSPPAAPNAELVVAKELKRATGTLIALEAVPGSDRLLAASEDAKVRLWSVSETKIIREFSSPGVAALGISRDGKQLLTGGTDGVVRVWNAETGKQTIELRGDTESRRRIAELEWAVAADALELAFQNQEVARTAAEAKTIEELLKKANETIEMARKVLPEKQAAAKTAREAKTAAQKAVDEVEALIAKLPEGKTDAALEKQKKEAQDKLAVAVGMETAMVGAATASENHLKDAEAEIQRVNVTKTKNIAASAAAGSAVTKTKEDQTKMTAELAAARAAAATKKVRPRAVSFSADGQTVAALFSDGSMDVWGAASGLPILHVAGGGEIGTASIASTAGGAFIACREDGSIVTAGTGSQWVLERTLGGETADSPFVDRVNVVRFSPDGKTLAAGGGEPTRSGDISFFDVATGKLVKTWNERHTDAVLSLDFSPDGKLLASGGADKIARVTDIATGKQVNLFEGHTHHVLGVTFRSDGRILATAGADNAVIIWDMIIGERKKKIEGWTKEVTSLQFIGATDQIVTSAGDNLVRIVNDQGGQIRSMPKLPDFMQSAASTPTASVIVGGGEDSLLRVWNGTNGEVLATFEAR